MRTRHRSTRRAQKFLFRCAFSAVICLFLPSLSAAAEGGGNTGSLLFIGKTFNVAVVVLVLIGLLRKPLKEFVANRGELITAQLAEAQLYRAHADLKIAEMRERIANLDGELSKIRETAREDAEAEYKRLVDEAQGDAQKIIARTGQEIEAMTRAAILELKGDAANLTVRLAEESIRREINDEDRARLFREFVRDLRSKA